MTPLEAKVVLVERQRREKEDKFLSDNLWSLYKFTGYDFDRVKLQVLYDAIGAAMNENPRAPAFRTMIRNAVIRAGSHVVFVKGKRHFRGVRQQ